MNRSGSTSVEKRHLRAVWVSREILPHEARVRAWMRRSHVAEDDIDELIQEAYCRIAMLEGVEHIGSAYAYFFSVVRNLLVRRLKRQQVVPLETIAEIDSYEDDRPSPERHAAGTLAYGKVMRIMARLPERCRRIVHLRKIEGWSQREIAEHFGTTEKAVEKQVWVGVRLICEAWSRGEHDADQRFSQLDEREGRRS